VVEEVDLLDVLPAVSADQRVVEDVEPKSMRILRREHGQIPERQKVRDDDERSRQREQDPGRHAHRLVQESGAALEDWRAKHVHIPFALSFPGLDEQVALHLLMQRRAEVGAVVREDALLGRERHRLSRRDRSRD
jgi:hypothetical protein